jgi:hypothetical protein
MLDVPMMGGKKIMKNYFFKDYDSVPLPLT